MIYHYTILHNIPVIKQFTVFFELRTQKTVRILEQIMFADKYTCIYSRKIEAIVYLTVSFIVLPGGFSLLVQVIT